MVHDAGRGPSGTSLGMAESDGTNAPFGKVISIETQENGVVRADVGVGHDGDGHNGVYERRGHDNVVEDGVTTRRRGRHDEAPLCGDYRACRRNDGMGAC